MKPLYRMNFTKALESSHICTYMHISVLFPTNKGVLNKAPNGEGALQTPIQEAQQSPCIEGFCKAHKGFRKLLQKEYCAFSIDRGFTMPLYRMGFEYTYMHTYIHFGIFPTDMGATSKSPYRERALQIL